MKLKTTMCIILGMAIATGCVKRKKKGAPVPPGEVPQEIAEASLEEGKPTTPAQNLKLLEAVPELSEVKRTILGRWQGVHELKDLMSGNLFVYEFAENANLDKTFTLTKICNDSAQKTFVSAVAKTKYSVEGSTLVLPSDARGEKALSNGSKCVSEIKKANHPFSFDAAGDLLLKSGDKTHRLTPSKIIDRPRGRWQAVNYSNNSNNKIFFDFKEDQLEKTMICDVTGARAMASVSSPFSLRLKDNIIEFKNVVNRVVNFAEETKTCTAALPSGRIPYMATDRELIFTAIPDYGHIRPLEGIFTNDSQDTTSIIEVIEIGSDSIKFTKSCFDAHHLFDAGSTVIAGITLPTLKMHMATVIAQAPIVSAQGDEFVVGEASFSSKTYGRDNAFTCATVIPKGTYRLSYDHKLNVPLRMYSPGIIPGNLLPAVRDLRKI